MTNFKRFLTLFLISTLAISVWGAALSLPYSWDASAGSSAYTEALGCTKTSLGSDYSSAPKLKFNSDGSALLIQVADSPEEISFNFKQNGTSPGTFEVQESTDGSSFTTAKTITWPGNGTTTSITASLNSASRYIKLIHVTKGTGTNAAVGGVSITKAGSSTTVATPTFSPAEGSYSSTQSVTISCATDGATIRYTTNGSNPTSTSTVYTSALSISATTTVKAKAFKSGMTDSEVATATYTITGGGGGGCDYTEATSLAVDDEVWIIVDARSKVMTGAAAGAVTTFSTCADDNYKFTVEAGANTGWYALKSANTDQYIGCAGSGTGLIISTTKSASTDWQLTEVSGTYYLKNKATARYILLYNNDNMRGYTNESQASTEAPTIYKKASDCTTPTAITITSAASAFVGTPLSLTCTGGNGGTVVWSVTNGTGTATVTGSTLTPLTAGTVTVKASQAKNTVGLTTYCAVSKTQEITIGEAPVTVRFFNNGSLLSERTMNIASGSSMGASMPELTSGDACDGTSDQFAGWTTQTIEDATTTIDGDQLIGPHTEITSNLDLNALWASESATVSTFDATDDSNITESTEYYEWSENTTGVIFGGGATASLETGYFEITKSGGNLYAYIDGLSNVLVSKYVLTISGAVGTYGVTTPAYGTLSTSGTTQTISKLYKTGFTSVSSSNSKIRISKAQVYTYTNYLTHCSRVKKPVISPTSGTYYTTGGQEITMTTATDGADIYYTYTTDGSTPADPTSSSTHYTAAIPFSTFSAGQTVTIKAIATKDGMGDSQIASVTYTMYEGKCKRPTFTPGTGTYSSAQSVVINSTESATIYYTTDGTDPTTSGTRLVYSTAVSITEDGTTIRAYAEKSGYEPSDIGSAEYTIEVPHTITYHVPAGYVAPASETVASTTLPAAVVEPCDDWRFVGWYTSNLTSKTTDITPLKGTYRPESDIDLYAVYAAEESSGSSTYDKVTETPADWSGEYLIVYETGSVAFDGSLETLDATENTIDVTISANKIIATSAIDAASFIIAKTGSNYTIQNKDGYYIGRTATSNGMNVSSSTAYTHTITLSGSNAVITSSGGPVLKYNDASNQLRFRYFASGQKAIQLYKKSGGVTKYWSSPSCTACTEAVVTLSKNSVLMKTTESSDITVTSNNTSTMTVEVEDLSIASATIVGNVVTVRGVNNGTTSLYIRQTRDKTDVDHPICAVTKVVPITIKDALIDVVDVGTNYITIEHNYGGGTSITMQEQLTTLDGEPADDIFFSKYYEAASHMKLFGLYNGTEDAIDMTKLRVRSGSSSWGDHGNVNLGSVTKLGIEYPGYQLPPFTEIIFWSNKEEDGNNKDLRDCINMTIGNNTYNFNDMKNGNIKGWYRVGEQDQLDADGNKYFNFNGDDAVILERNTGGDTWEIIDLIGAGTSSAPNNSACIKITTQYSIAGSNQALNDEPGGWHCEEDNEGHTLTIPYSTNRYLLTRKKEVKSGANAVTKNITDFVTLAEEWNGIAVGGGSSFCYSGEQFSIVGQYDYANYYTEFKTMDASEAVAVPQADGTVKVTITDLTDRACDYLNIQIKEAGEVVAEMKYKVPIIVSTAKATTDEIFYNEGVKGCSRCDVVVLSGASLTKALDGSTNDMPEVRDLEVYAGGKLVIPDGNYNYTMRSLTIRSNEDNVGAARIDGTAITDNIYHDKRMRGGSTGRWYWMCLPYACNIKDVQFRSGEAAIYGTDWLLQVYDGQQRVNTASGAQNGWRRIDATTTKQIQPGTGYIVWVATKEGHTFGELRFPMAGYQESASKYVPVDDYGAGVSVTPNHKGWNLVGNPFMDYYQKGNLEDQGLTLGRLVLNSEGTEWEIETPATVPYITIPQNGGYSEYTQVTAGSMNLPPFISYFVQIAGSDPDVDENDLKVAFNPAKRGQLPSPRRIVEDDENQPIWVSVALHNSSTESDETTLVISDNYTNDYEIGGDLYKWRGSGYKYSSITTKPVLASRNNAGEMAFNALPDNSARDGVYLNYFAAAQGQYTFEMLRKYNMDFLESVLLVDMQEGITTNLLEKNYSFESEKGDNTSRFKLIVDVNRSKKVTTGFEHLSYSETPRKILINGHVYIQRGGAIYDITGKEVFNF